MVTLQQPHSPKALMLADAENGQPINGGRLKAIARSRHHSFTCLDATTQPLAEAPWYADRVLLECRDYQGILRLPHLLRQVRVKYPATPVYAVGPYSEFNEAHLRSAYRVEVLRGDPEQIIDTVFGPSLRRPEWDWTAVVPDRSDFRPLGTYPKLRVPVATEADAFDSARWVEKVAGNVEFSFGCLHKCTYCSVAAKYDGAQTEYPAHAVLTDMDQLVAAGAEHIAITDADAFGRPSHVLGVLRAAHAKHPHLTFDAVTRVDHIRKIRKHLPELRALGVVKLTSSFEFPDDRVLRAVNKGFNAADIPDAIAWCRGANIALAPTFIPFNPWVGAAEIAALTPFLERHGLDATTEGTQLATRLLLYKGSPLLNTPAITGLKLNLTEREFHFDWVHPDPHVEDLYRCALERYGSGGKCCIRC